MSKHYTTLHNTQESSEAYQRYSQGSVQSLFSPFFQYIIFGFLYSLDQYALEKPLLSWSICLFYCVYLIRINYCGINLCDTYFCESWSFEKKLRYLFLRIMVIWKKLLYLFLRIMKKNWFFWNDFFFIRQRKTFKNYSLEITKQVLIPSSLAYVFSPWLYCHIITNNITTTVFKTSCTFTNRQLVFQKRRTVSSTKWTGVPNNIVEINDDDDEEWTPTLS